MEAHLLRCQGLAVDHYSFNLGRLAVGLPSTFDQLGLQPDENLMRCYNRKQKKK